jgi:dihydroxyacetone kinase-like protein
MTLNGEQVAQMLKAAAQCVIANEPALTKADQAIGDGDHGIGMARGFKAALAALDKLGAVATPKSAFSVVGMAVLSNAGGASGAIFGVFFQGAGKALGTEEIDAEALAKAIEAGADAVVARGKAKAGDKTMVDALLPAVEALKAQASGGVVAALRAAATASAAGAASTADMLASLGRARNLGERARGHVDPGALSISLVFEGMARAIDART